MEHDGALPAEELCRAYGLGAARALEPLRGGTVAHVWHMTTETGDFLLRTLTGEEQGAREWAIFRHLAERDFRNVPTIRATAEGRSAVRVGGVWCQLQNFCPGVMPDPTRSGTVRQGAETVLRLTAALADCPAVTAPDRFDLARTWREARLHWDSTVFGQSLEWADRAVERCCALPEGRQQVIHGDLGPWNMLDTARGLLVVDFGEARMGDPYFDLASALAGFINHAPETERAWVLSEFEAGCAAVAPLERGRLLEQTALWTWRGVAQWLTGGEPALREKMVGKFLFALSWLEAHLSGT